MKLIKITTLLIFLASYGYAQDLIVTNEGDSINCKITKVKSGNIYFTFLYKNEIRNTLLPVSQIKTHQYRFYETSEVPRGTVRSHENYPKFRIAINGGYSYQTAKIAEGVPADFKDYVRKLKSGYHLGGDATYYLSEQIGLGAKYCLFKTSNRLDNIYLEDMDGNREYGTMADDLRVTYIGPTLSTRILNDNKKNALLANVSLGYMAYNNDKVLIDKYKMTGSTLGLALDLGYDIGLSKNLQLGFQVSMVTGTLFKYHLSDGSSTQTIKLEKGEYESLNRLDLSIGIRFVN